MEVGQIRELRTWATRLEERADNDELRAAARAILMLAEEVEELQARLVVAAAAASPPAGETPAETPAAETRPREARRTAPSQGFLKRVRRAFGLD